MTTILLLRLLSGPASGSFLAQLDFHPDHQELWPIAMCYATGDKLGALVLDQTLGCFFQIYLTQPFYKLFY